MRPAMQFSSVDLPEPDSPTMATTSPAKRSRSASCTAWRSSRAEAKRCDRPRTRSSGSFMAMSSIDAVGAPVGVRAGPTDFGFGVGDLVEEARRVAAALAGVAVRLDAERVVLEVQALHVRVRRDRVEPLLAPGAEQLQRGH